MKLRELSRHVFFLEDQPNIGLIREGDAAILVDSGAHEKTAAALLKILEREGLYPLAIINTHGHADHCGGNHHIKSETGALIHAPQIEASFIQSPLLEPLGLFSGANPPHELKTDLVKGSPVDHVIGDGEKSLAFETLELNIIRLPGHSPNQVGLALEDILFCGDAIFSEELLDYYKIPYHTDIVRQKETLALLRDSRYNLYVPAHSPPFKDAAGLARYNLDIIEGVERFLLRSLQRPRTAEEVMQELCARYGIEISKIKNGYLMHTITQAFLSSLREQGALTVGIRNNLPCWRKR